MGDSQYQIGVIGLGTAARMMLPAIAAHRGMALAAVADPVQEVRESVGAQWGVPSFESIEALVAMQHLDAVYIATPTEMHAQHTCIAVQAGLHVLCEKPMAAHLEDAQTMVVAAARAQRVLMIGHSRSYDAPIHKMREIIESGALGRVRMVTQLSYTDWIYRPRRPDELDPARGGGITYRQGAHQFDVIRLLAGGLATQVNATTFDFDPARPATGAHTVVIRFADGAIGNAIYNGYGAFLSAELSDDVDEGGFAADPAAIGARRRAFGSVRGGEQRDETVAKRERAARMHRGQPPFHPSFGLTLVSCEKGDMRQSRNGISVYTAGGREDIALPIPPGPQDMVVSEFHDALSGLRAPVHDGRWGLANLEVCVAATESARNGKEVALTRQVAVPMPR
ncbi:Gfo/Idh/MocA family oxidoreductase [Paraburkholderia dipogonis]|uniref:Gfo/Idh/MocA family oxidoreductase n=1 Tax=Paraburkholderia dipogonis TaxID=1211383 RepID=UPI0038BE19B8